MESLCIIYLAFVLDFLTVHICEALSCCNLYYLPCVLLAYCVLRKDIVLFCTIGVYIHMHVYLFSSSFCYELVLFAHLNVFSIDVLICVVYCLHSLVYKIAACFYLVNFIAYFKTDPYKVLFITVTKISRWYTTFPSLIPAKGD